MRPELSAHKIDRGTAHRFLHNTKQATQNSPSTHGPIESHQPKETQAPGRLQPPNKSSHNTLIYKETQKQTTLKQSTGHPLFWCTDSSLWPDQFFQSFKKTEKKLDLLWQIIQYASSVPHRRLLCFVILARPFKEVARPEVSNKKQTYLSKETSLWPTAS